MNDNDIFYGTAEKILKVNQLINRSIRNPFQYNDIHVPLMNGRSL